MALTESKMLPLGTQAPNFFLPDTVSGNLVEFKNITQKASASVVLFWCNHCPYVLHLQAEVVRCAREYSALGVVFVAISSNDIAKYPDDAPDKMKLHAQRYRYPFPYLFDETQAVAHAYDAACTPDFYVFGANHRLVYRGRFDDSRPKNNTPATGADLRQALDAVLNNSPMAAVQYPSLGCGIKWKTP